MSLLSADFDRTDDVEDESQDASLERSNAKIIHRATMAVLLIAAAVAGTLSAFGARALFSAGWPMAIAFAAVVQIIVTTSLWVLPGASARRKVLLLVAWLAAVLMSITSALHVTYTENSAEAVAELKDEAAMSLGAIATNIQKVTEAARLAEKQAEDEELRGTYSGEGPGQGREYRKLQEAAVSARARADEAVPRMAVVSAALEALKQPGLTAEQVRSIYTDTAARAGTYAQDVTKPDFSSDKRSFVVIVTSAFKVALGFDRTASQRERSHVQGSLCTAAIMEILALLCALMRLEMHRKPRRRKSSLLTRLVQAVATFVSLPTALGIAVRLCIADLFSALMGDPTMLWTQSIHAQAATPPRRSIGQLIRSLLPAGSALRRSNRRRQARNNVQLFDARVFAGKQIILNVALKTGVIVIDADNELAPGPRWDEWIRFLISSLPTPPPRVRQTGPNRAKPKLRVVNG